MPAQVNISFKPPIQELRNKFANIDIDGFLSEQVQTISFKVERESKRVTPVDTGRLRASIYTTISAGGLRGVIQPNTEYAFFVHEGTRYMRPRPFMYWGAEDAAIGLEDRMAKKLDRVIRNAIE